MEECERVTHGHRHGDCLPGSVDGVSYGPRAVVVPWLGATAVKGETLRFVLPSAW